MLYWLVIMEKYELREGEKFIKEYIDNDGKPVIIFEDKNGKIMHGWVLDIDAKTAELVNKAAEAEGMDPDDYIIILLDDAIKELTELDNKRKAIEEISD